MRKAAPPAGNVVFSSDGVQIGTVALTNGVAVLNDSSLSLGTHSIVAVYQGGGGFGGSTSNTVQQVVQLPATTTTVTSSPNPSTVRTAGDDHCDGGPRRPASADRDGELHIEWHCHLRLHLSHTEFRHSSVRHVVAAGGYRYDRRHIFR